MPQTRPAGSSLAILSEVPGTELRQLRATFENFRDFVVRYSPWLSDSCIFVETLEAVPVGAPIRLEIRLRDRPFLIRALGQVDWVRSASDGDEDGPPGAALNITYLDPASTHLIDSIFRLYTGQQSAAMGEEVVETWELDVESLIDQAFPGAPAPVGTTPAGTSPAGTSPADATPTATETSGPVSANTTQPLEVVAKPEPPPEMGVPDELGVPIELAELELPDALAEPAASTETAAVAATEEPVDVTPLGVSEPPATDEEMEWEARLSAAFAEHDTVEPELAHQTEALAQQEVPSAAEASGFGFGLVEEPSLTTTDPVEDLPPLTDDTAIFSPEPASESALPRDPGQTVPIQPVVERPAPVVPAEVAAAPMREDRGLSPASVVGAQELAGAASVSDASDASFLRRSVLVFLLAVVIVGLVLVWFRVRQTTPSGGETIAETSVESGTPPESVGPPSDASPSVSPPASAEPSASESSPGVATSGEAPAGAPKDTPVTPTTSEPAVVPSSEPTAENPPAPEQSVEAEPSIPVAAAQDPATIVEDVEQQVKAWAAAWSKQEPEAYIECYAPDYSPAGTGRREWERQRAARIRAPASILVQAKDISVTVLDGSRARATFYQDYETDTKHLYTWKTMELARQPEGWKIVKERVGR